MKLPVEKKEKNGRKERRLNVLSSLKMDGTLEKTVTHLLNWWSHVYMEGWCWEPCLWLMLFFFYSASNLRDYTWAIHHQCKQMFFNVLSRVNSRNFHNICDNVNSSLCWDFLHTLYSLLLDHWAVFSKEEHKTERRAKICPVTLQHDENLPLSYSSADPPEFDLSV